MRPLSFIVLLASVTALRADVLSHREFKRSNPGSMNREVLRIEEHEDNTFEVNVYYWFEGDINRFFPLGFPETGRVTLLNFSAKAGEIPLRIERESAGQNGHFTFRGHRFPALFKITAPRKLLPVDGETQLTNSFFFKAPEFSFKNESKKYRLIEYVLVTGGGWPENQIGRLSISIKLRSPDCGCMISANNFPTGRCVDAYHRAIELHEWKPDRNLEFLTTRCAQK